MSVSWRAVRVHVPPRPGLSRGRHRKAQPHDGLSLRLGAGCDDGTRAAGRYTPITGFMVIAALAEPINVRSFRRPRRETPLLPFLRPPPRQVPEPGVHGQRGWAPRA